MCGYSKQCFCRGCNISAYISVTTSLCNNDNALHLRHIFFGDIRLTALLRIVINIACASALLCSTAHAPGTVAFLDHAFTVIRIRRNNFF